MLSRLRKVLLYPSTCMTATCGTVFAGGMIVYSRHAGSMRCLAEKFIFEHANQFNCTAYGKPCNWDGVPRRGEFGFNCTSLQNEPYLLNNASAYASQILSPKEFNLYLWAAALGVFLGLVLVVCARAFCMEKSENTNDDESINDSEEYEPILGENDSCCDELAACLPERRLSFARPRFFSSLDNNAVTETGPTVSIGGPAV